MSIQRCKWHKVDQSIIECSKETWVGWEDPFLANLAILHNFTLPLFFLLKRKIISLFDCIMQLNNDTLHIKRIVVWHVFSLPSTPQNCIVWNGNDVPIEFKWKEGCVCFSRYVLFTQFLVHLWKDYDMWTGHIERACHIGICTLRPFLWWYNPDTVGHLWEDYEHELNDAEEHLKQYESSWENYTEKSPDTCHSLRSCSSIFFYYKDLAGVWRCRFSRIVCLSSSFQMVTVCGNSYTIVTYYVKFPEVYGPKSIKNKSRA